MIQERAELDRIVERWHGESTALLQILREAQEIDGWLPPATLTYLAQALDLPRARVEGVAGFYSFLHLQPAGRYRVLFSDNITDRMAGNLELLDRFCTNLWLERGKGSEDGLVLADTTSCTGMCDQGPAVLVNGWAIPRMTAERVDQIVELIRAGSPVEQWPAELFHIEDNIHRRDILLDSSLEAGEAIRAAMSRTLPDTTVPAAQQGSLATLEAIKGSNLRGRGGAGFATGLKWEACRNAAGRHALRGVQRGRG